MFPFCVYTKDFIIQKTWDVGENICCICPLMDGQIVVGDQEGTLYVYSIDHEMCLVREQNAHPTPLLFLFQLRNGQLVSVCHDQLKVWDIGEKIDVKYTVKDAWRYCLDICFQLLDGRIIGVSYEKEFDSCFKAFNNYIYIFELGYIRYEQYYHIGFNKCIQLFDGRILFAKCRNTSTCIRIITDWTDVKVRTPVYFTFHQSIDEFAQLDNGQIVCVSYYHACSIHILNLDTYDPKMTPLYFIPCVVFMVSPIQFICQSSTGTDELWQLDGSHKNMPPESNVRNSMVLYTKEDLKEGRRRLFSLLEGYVAEDLKPIVFSYVYPLPITSDAL
jgi:hypothetical protein